jgi:hypothetical protein
VKTEDRRQFLLASPSRVVLLTPCAQHDETVELIIIIKEDGLMLGI